MCQTVSKIYIKATAIALIATLINTKSEKLFNTIFNMNETLSELPEAQWSLPLLSPALLTVAILTLLHFYHENSHKAKLANQIPGPKSYPFIGNANMILGLKSNHHLYKRALKLSDKFGRVVRGWAGWKLIIFLYVIL